MKRFLKSVPFLLIMALGVEARENPFEPVVQMEQMPITTLSPTVVPDLDQLKIKMPAGARVLKGVQLEYQDANAEHKTHFVAVDKKINWHEPLYLSHRQMIQYKRQEYTPFDFLTIEHEKDNFFIKTSQELLRSFHLLEPFKLVLDFKDDENSFMTHRESMEPPARSFAVGDHRGYFRVVIELDAVYRYEVHERDDGVKVELK